MSADSFDNHTIELPPEQSFTRVTNIQAARTACIAAFILICIFVSCASHPARNSNGRTLTDELNRTIIVPSHPDRIISLAPSITETLFALGVGERIVGVTTFCDYPPEALRIEKIGDTTRPSIEKIVALRPDLVIVSTASQLEQFVSKLEEIGIAAYVSNPRDIEGVLRSIVSIGELVDARDRATELAASLGDRIEAVRKRVESGGQPSVFFIVSSEPLFTVGSGTFIDDLITRAGGRSISANEPGDYPQYSMETALARQPEVIFLAGGADLPERLKQTPAALNGKVYRLDDNLLLRPGPRIVDGLEQMAARIHPESAAISQMKAPYNRPQEPVSRHRSLYQPATGDCF